MYRLISALAVAAALFLAALGASPEPARAQAALSPEVAAEIDRAAASIGELAFEPPPATRQGAAAYALAEARMGAAVIGAIARNPGRHAEIVAAAVAAAPALREPILAQASDSFPAFAPAMQTAALPPPEDDMEADANAPRGPRLEVSDPLEGLNRGIFWFNDILDTVLLRPIAWTYGFIFPDFFKEGMRNAFQNFNSPMILANDLLQFELENAAVTTGRLIVNSTIGLAGFFDVAEEIGLPYHYADLGQTFWSYGIDAGPYLVVPIFGPTTLRDGVGQIGDAFFHPRTYLLDFYTNLAITGGNLLVVREELLEPLDDLKETSLDYYAAVRSAWYQSRTVQLEGGRGVLGAGGDGAGARADEAFDAFDSFDGGDFDRSDFETGDPFGEPTGEGFGAPPSYEVGGGAGAPTE